MQQELKMAGIELLLQQNKEGLIYGITYIDYKTKTVFSDNSLGKDYSVNGLSGRMNGQAFFLKENPLLSMPYPDKTEWYLTKITTRKWKIEPIENELHDTPLVASKKNFNPEKLVRILFRLEGDRAFLPSTLKYNQRKKNGRKINN